MKIIIRNILFIILVSPGPVFSGQQSAGNIKSTVRLAMAQMFVEGGNKQANLDRAVQRIAEAAGWAVDPGFDNTKTPYINSGWQDAFNAVCREFNLSIAAVSNVGIVTDGPWIDWKCIGNSLFVSENPEEFTVLPYGEKADTILYQDVRLLERPARGNSWYNYWGSMGKK